MITILNPPKLEQNPTVIVRTSKVGEAYNSETQPHPGTFARVTLKTAKDWLSCGCCNTARTISPPRPATGCL